MSKKNKGILKFAGLIIGIGIGSRGSWKEYLNNTQVAQPEQLINSVVNITKDILIQNIKKTSGAA